MKLSITSFGAGVLLLIAFTLSAFAGVYNAPCDHANCLTDRHKTYVLRCKPVQTR